MGRSGCPITSSGNRIQGDYIMIPLLAGGVLAGFLLIKEFNKRFDTWLDEWFEEDNFQTTMQERQKLFYAASFWDQFRSGF
jgi:hypothetical protein